MGIKLTDAMLDGFNQLSFNGEAYTPSMSASAVVAPQPAPK